MNSTIALVLAGGKKPGLDILSTRRAKAAIPFGGGYRIIDFALTNLSRTAIQHVGILTQHRPESLMDHIMPGHAWGFHTLERDIKILPPYLGRGDFGWYKGTADSLYQNIDFIEKYQPDQVLVVSGDQVYRMNYSRLLDYHRRKGSEITLVVKARGQIPSRRYGVLEMDIHNRVTRFEEKLEEARGNYVSLGIYVFNRRYLVRQLKAMVNAGDRTNQIATDLIIPAVRRGRVRGYPFEDT
ncbi:NTP transferase domain-containing protein, partial [bacterium]|nr:NTP transferase domain-containing protein [candidate division CSSED10-310 bacterium]